MQGGDLKDFAFTGLHGVHDGGEQPKYRWAIRGNKLAVSCKPLLDPLNDPLLIFVRAIFPWKVSMIRKNSPLNLMRYPSNPNHHGDSLNVVHGPHSGGRWALGQAIRGGIPQGSLFTGIELSMSNRSFFRKMAREGRTERTKWRVAISAAVIG